MHNTETTSRRSDRDFTADVSKRGLRLQRAHQESMFFVCARHPTKAEVQREERFLSGKAGDQSRGEAQYYALPR